MRGRNSSSHIGQTQIDDKRWQGHSLNRWATVVRRRHLQTCWDTGSMAVVRCAGWTAAATHGSRCACITETSGGFCVVQIWCTSWIWLQICCFPCWFTAIESLGLRMCVSPDQSCSSFPCLWILSLFFLQLGQEPIEMDSMIWGWHECTQVGLHVFQREKIYGPTKVFRVRVHPRVQEVTESVLYLFILFKRAKEWITREDQTECHVNSQAPHLIVAVLAALRIISSPVHLLVYTYWCTLTGGFNISLQRLNTCISIQTSLWSHGPLYSLWTHLYWVLQYF